MNDKEKYVMKRCKRCILPEGFPGISFNDEGICNFCADYKEFRRPLGKDKLIDLVKSTKRQGRFDCVIPASGGKDSTYILYYTVKELGLRPLAVHYDSGYQTGMSKNNLKSACHILNAPLIIKKSSPDIQKKIIRQALLISEIVGSFTSRTCGNCEIMLRTVSLNAAREHNIPFVFWGSSPLESLDSKDYEGYRHGKSLFEAITSKITRFRELGLTPLKITRVMPRVIKYNILSICQRIQMGVPLKYAIHPTKVFPFPEKDPQFVHFFDYITWDSVRGVKLLEKELNWKRPEDKLSRFDCLLHCFGNHHHLQLKQITDDGKTYSNFVRENKMDRKEALMLEENIRNTVTGECRKIIEGLGLAQYRMPLLKSPD
jgi:hypothetical protein